METAWKADPDRAGILERLIPDTFAESLRYMNCLVGRGELDLARAAWGRVLKNEVPASSKFTMAESFSYIDPLLANNRIAEAQQVYDEALQKAGTGLRD